MENLVEKLCAETPNDYSMYVSDMEHKEKGGAYYMATVKFQDYFADADRQRIMLAFYFRWLLLTKAEGFEAIPAP